MSFNAPITIDNNGDVGAFTSVTIGSDSFPIISYYDQTNGNLKIVHCESESCNSFHVPLALDGTNINSNVGWDTSIAIGFDNTPIVSYYDVTNKDLKVAKCSNQACTGVFSRTTLDSFGDTGRFSNLSIGSDGTPIISYLRTSGSRFKFVKCLNNSCSQFVEPIEIESLSSGSFIGNIVIGLDSNPTLVTSRGLDFYHCTGLECISHTKTSLIPTSDFINDVSIALLSNGNPILSFYNNTTYTVSFYSCTNSDCTE